MIDWKIALQLKSGKIKRAVLLTTHSPAFTIGAVPGYGVNHHSYVLQSV